MADNPQKPGPKADILKITDPEKALDDLLGMQPKGDSDEDEKGQDDNAPTE